MRHRILVVAQDVTLRSTLARWLVAAGYFVELAEDDRRARQLLANQRMALTIVVLTAGTPIADPGERGGKLIIAAEPGQELGGHIRSARTADAYYRYPWTSRRYWPGSARSSSHRLAKRRWHRQCRRSCRSMVLPSTWPGARCVTATETR